MITGRSVTIGAWLAQLVQQNAISSGESIRLGSYDNAKVERLRVLNEKINLPINNYVTIDHEDWQRRRKYIARELEIGSNTLLSVRLEIEGGDRTRRHERAHGLRLGDVDNFIGGLVQKNEHAQVRICEYWVPQLSGHMIISGQGVLIEGTRGRLMALSQQWARGSEMFHGIFRFPQAGFHFSTDDRTVRLVLWNAFRKVLWNESRQCVRKPFKVLPGYYEFVYHELHGHCFVDFNQSHLFCSRVFSDDLPSLDALELVPTLQAAPFHMT